jgi:hypothetical protein
MGKFKHEFWCTKGLLLLNQDRWYLIERIRSKALHLKSFFFTLERMWFHDLRWLAFFVDLSEGKDDTCFRITREPIFVNWTIQCLVSVAGCIYIYIDRKNKSVLNTIFLILLERYCATNHLEFRLFTSTKGSDYG